MLNINNIINGDILLKKDKYNKTLNKIGKNPLTYQYPYEKTRDLCLSMNSQTKSMIIYILKKEKGFVKTKELAYIFNISEKSYRQNIIRIKEEGLLDDYKILYSDFADKFYNEFLIK